jgi:hypothetical protein
VWLYPVSELNVFARYGALHVCQQGVDSFAVSVGRFLDLVWFRDA